MIKILEHVATECGRLILSSRESAMKAENKAEQLGQHFSTQADRRSQELGLTIFNEMVPGEVVIAEEAENKHEVPADCTVFDPLDGTTNYFNGIDDFGVTACTLRGGIPVCGATFFPVKKLLISAVQGKGCYIGGFKDGRRLDSIPWHGNLDKSQLGTDVGSWTLQQNTFDLILRPLAERFNVLSSMAAVEGGSKVLMGQLGAYYNFGIAKIWDAAAMTLAVMEAGGVACDPKGNPIQWNSINCDWVVAGNSALAEVILKHSRKWKGRT